MIRFRIYLKDYLGRGGIFHCISSFPLPNILRALLGKGWSFPLRIRVSTSEYTKKITWGEVVLIECVVKGYHECGFTVTAGETHSWRGFARGELQRTARTYSKGRNL